MIVVLDSNVWLAELGLRSGAAAAVRFFLNQSGAKVAIPEVVQLEVRYNLTRLLGTHVQEIRDNYRKLLTAFGKLKEIVLPTEQEIQVKVEELFSSLGVQQQEIPFSLESARSALFKAIQKQSPCDKTQEFKDAVIWADCVGLLATDDVVLVTNDKAFYRDRTYDKGLAQNLLEEISLHPNQLRILSNLSELLGVIQAPIPLDEDQLQKAVFNAFGQSINGMLDRTGFSPDVRQSTAYKLFATDNPSELFFEYSINITCSDARGEGRTNAIFNLKGDGLYSPTDQTFLGLRNLGEHLTYMTADGTSEDTRSGYAYASGLYLGHREVTHEVRQALHTDGR